MRQRKREARTLLLRGRGVLFFFFRSKKQEEEKREDHGGQKETAFSITYKRLGWTVMKPRHVEGKIAFLI